MAATMIGRVRVDQVLEHEMSTRPPEQMFPELDPAAWQRHSGELAPEYWDPATGLLRSRVQTWVLRAGDETVLVDTGIGNGKPRSGTPTRPADHAWRR